MIIIIIFFLTDLQICFCFVARALATVEIPPLEDKQGVQVGWIQTCVNMHFVNQYGTDGAWVACHLCTVPLSIDSTKCLGPHCDLNEMEKIYTWFIWPFFVDILLLIPFREILRIEFRDCQFFA